MHQDLFAEHRVSIQHVPQSRPERTIPVSAALVLVVVIALVVIAVSIGVVQADTLSEMVDDDEWRLALFGLVSGIVVIGGVTAAVMWLTAPSPVRAPAPMRAASFRRIPTAP